jgi:hypothetical protein
MGYSLSIGQEVTDQLIHMPERDHDLLLLEMLALGTDPERGHEMGVNPDGVVRRALGVGDIGMIFFWVDHDRKWVSVVEVLWLPDQ